MLINYGRILHIPFIQFLYQKKLFMKELIRIQFLLTMENTVELDT